MSIVLVTFKDEGGFGFINLVTDADVARMPNRVRAMYGLPESDDAPERSSLGVPFDPNRERPFGSRREARALAAEHGVPMVEV